MSKDGTTSIVLRELEPLIEAEATVLIVHGAGLNGASLLPFAHELRQHIPSFCTVCIDLRWHGESTAAPEALFSEGLWDLFSDDLSVAADHFSKLGPLYVFGFSMGGAITLITALRERPGLFAGIIFYEPIISLPKDSISEVADGNSLTERARRRRYEFPDKAEALRHLRAKGPFDKWRLDAAELYVEHGLSQRDPSSTVVRLNLRPGPAFHCMK